MVKLTPKAAEFIKSVMPDEQKRSATFLDHPVDPSTLVLRFGVQGDGCSGFKPYAAIDEPQQDDIIYESNGVKIHVDSKSDSHLDGFEVDYVDAGLGGGLLFNNPSVCGCGHSCKDEDGSGKKS